MDPLDRANFWIQHIHKFKGAKHLQPKASRNLNLYKTNAKYRASLFREQEMDPLDRANFWIQHIHKFKGAKHLQPKAATMPLYQYFLLDV
ncbi:UDP-glucoronosyl and UDP-glucosyl transferase, partial [Popillia japonica]